MTSLKDLVKNADANVNLFVTGPHYKWMEKAEEDQVYSPEAIQHVQDVLSRKYKHERSGRFSPSSMGMCPRRQVLSFAGAPQVGFDEASLEMMDHGTWIHLKWQAEGITMGWMAAGEVWVHDEGLRCGGSMDGRNSDGSMFELKSAAPSVYTRTVADNKAPKYENMLQVATYELIADIDFASVVFEDRAYGNFHEFRIARTAKLEREVIRRLKSLNQWVDDGELPPMLEECEMRIGKVFKSCPYRKICHIPKNLAEAQALSHPKEAP